MIDRRTFVGSVVGGIFATPLAEAQQSAKLARIGYLGTSLPAEIAASLEALQHGYANSAMWRVGTSRSSTVGRKGRMERLSALAVEFVGLKIDLIVASSSPAALAAKDATRTIPIVFVMAGDPVDSGFVASIARPGG